MASTAKTQPVPGPAAPAPESPDANRARDIWNELARLEMLDELYPNLDALASALRRVEAWRLQTAAPPLLAALRAVDASSAPVFFELESVAKTLIHITFASAEQSAAGLPRHLETLTPEQRETLAALTESDTLWRHGGGNARALLQPLGVPPDRDELRRFLAG